MNTATKNYSPSNFPDSMEADGIVVEYSDLHEIQQGSPDIGKLSVNGVLLSGLFGGPALIVWNIGGRKSISRPEGTQPERSYLHDSGEREMRDL